MVERAVFSIPEAAIVLGISRASLYEAVKRKEIRVVRIGWRMMVPKSVISELLRGEQPQPASPVQRAA